MVYFCFSSFFVEFCFKCLVFTGITFLVMFVNHLFLSLLSPYVISDFSLHLYQDSDTKSAIGWKSYNTLMRELGALDMESWESDLMDCDNDCVAATTASLDIPSPSFLRHMPIADGISDLIRKFLKNNANQLTVYGLFCLQEGLKERELCVFFRNNHFNTMFKYEGELYLLATDQDYIRQPDLVWEKLDEDLNAENPETRSWDEQNAFASTADMEKSGCKEIDLTSLADTFNLQATHSDPTNQSVRENVRAAEHKESQQIEEYIGNGEKAADVNRDEDGSCLAGGAIRMDSEPSGQGKRQADNDHVKQPAKKKRSQDDGDYLVLKSGSDMDHRDKVEHGGPIKQMVLKTRCDMDDGIVPLRSVEHRGPIKQMVLKTRCDMDGGIVPLHSVEHRGPIKQMVLKTRCDMDGGIVPLRSVEHGGPIKQLVLKTRCDMDGGIVLLRSVEHGGPIKQMVLKTRCDMDGGIVPLHSVEHREPIKQMVFKTRCDMDGGIVPLHSVEQRGPIKQMVVKSHPHSGAD
ncbi:ubiquitin carboxyl-terminal hydrolase MINDY-1 isoform X2 [Tanacetum coccineum]